MGRRTSSGRIGAPTFGGLLAADNTTITTDDNADIILDPTGTGNIKLDGTTEILSQSPLRFYDSESANYLGFSAPGSVTEDVTWQLPDGDGSVNQVLATNGSGVLSWSTPGVTIADNNTDSDTAYFASTTQTSGSVTSFNIASTKISFVASTGTLSLENIIASNDLQADSLGVGTPASGVSGEIRATNQITSFYSSDINLKENIKNITDPLQKVKLLNGVTFDWTEDYIVTHGGEDGYFVRKNDIGLIAQEVEAVLPEIVGTNSEGYKAIKYDRIVALLVEVVKELSKKIDNLKD